MKNKLANTIKIILIIVCLSSLIFGCEEKNYDIDEYDTLVYYDDNVIFSDAHIFTETDGTVYMVTTVSVPKDVQVINYGHCWVTYEQNPTLDDNNTSFGRTSLKNFTISSEIKYYSSWQTYYLRAYIETENGVIYDKTRYFKNQ